MKIGLWLTSVILGLTTLSYGNASAGQPSLRDLILKGAPLPNARPANMHRALTPPYGYWTVFDFAGAPTQAIGDSLEECETNVTSARAMMADYCASLSSTSDYEFTETGDTACTDGGDGKYYSGNIYDKCRIPIVMCGSACDVTLSSLEGWKPRCMVNAGGSVFVDVAANCCDPADVFVGAANSTDPMPSCLVH